MGVSTQHGQHNHSHDLLGLPCHSGPRLLLPRGGGQQRLEGGLPPHQLRLPVLQPHLCRLRRARAGQLQVCRLHRRQVVLHRPQLRHLLPGPDPISKVPCQPLVLRGLRHPHYRLLRVPCRCGSCHRCCLCSLDNHVHVPAAVVTTPVQVSAPHVSVVDHDHHHVHVAAPVVIAHDPHTHFDRNEIPQGPYLAPIPKKADTSFESPTLPSQPSRELSIF